MIRSAETEVWKAVYKLNCGACGVTSYIGYECTEEQIQKSSFGMMGLEKADTEVNIYIHCPACDANITDWGDADAQIEDITKGQPV